MDSFAQFYLFVKIFMVFYVKIVLLLQMTFMNFITRGGGIIKRYDSFEESAENMGRNSFVL